MKYVNYARYVSDQDKVSTIRPTHQLYVRRLISEGRLLLAGPFTDGSGGLFVYEAESLEAAQAIAANDPYNTGGAFASYRISEWDLRGVHYGILQLGMDKADKTHHPTERDHSSDNGARQNRELGRGSSEESLLF